MKVNEVLKTEDLSIFTQMVGNRPPNPKHVRRLEKSIEKYGLLQNPIIVNENMQVIDGQHRLLAAVNKNSPIYYIVVKGYSLNQVQILNLNQKNWAKSDFLVGYAKMGLESYVKLMEFRENNKDFLLSNCISLCSNNSSARYSSHTNVTEVFNEGTWVGGDFDLAQENADKLKSLEVYYGGYNRTSFVSCMLGLLNKDVFDFEHFVHKLALQPTALMDCTTIKQYTELIEHIYNFRSRAKINLRY